MITDGPKWTAYVPMPERVRAAVVGDGGALRDLVDLARPRSDSSGTAAGRALERLFRDAATVLLTNSGSSALLLALRQRGVSASDEVIIASFNCPQVAEAVLATGAHPVLADCDPDTGALDPASMRRLITSRTRCVVLTHQFGFLPGTTSVVLEIAAAHGIGVIDDAAQALGARYRGRPAGQLAEVGVLSFGRTKPLSCLGGGALILPPGARAPSLPESKADSIVHPAVRAGYEHFIRGRSTPIRHALTRLAPLLPLHTDVAQALETRSHGVEEPGPMSARTARLLARKLAGLDATMAGRRAAARRLAQALTGLPLALPPVEAEEYSASCFAIRLAPESRHALGTFLSHRGFQTSWYHYPLHRLSRYREFAQGSFPGTEHLWPRNLILPHRSLTPRLTDELGRSIHEFFRS